MTSCRFSHSTHPSWNGSFPTCSKIRSSSRPRVARCGCMRNPTCGNVALRLQPSGAERRRQNVSHPNSVKVSVSDTGPGIPAEFHLEVFDDFFRLPGTEAKEGMGLGLAIARRLVSGMGGKIWVESDPGAGLQVFISHSVQTRCCGGWQGEEPMKQTAKILLVDDEPGMLRYIKTLLEVDDYKVETATTGEEALQRIDKGLEPDLVLLDVLMPGIDGLQTLEQLRQKKPGVKVVMLSCVGGHSQSRAGDEAGRPRLSDQAIPEGRTGCGHRFEPWAKATSSRAKSKNSLMTYSSSLPALPCARYVRRQPWWPM